MKKIVSLLCVAVLVLSSCNKSSNKESGDAAQTTPAAESSNPVLATEGTIAYFNIDSLISKYAMYEDLRAAYEVKAKKAETTVNAQGRSLEKDLRDYQEKIQKGLVTSSQAQALEESLNKKQQAFVQHRDKVMNELAEEEQVLMNRIHYSILEYVKGFNSDLRFKMILSTTSGGPVINADPSLDLTSVLLEGINQQYAADKKAGKVDLSTTPISSDSTGK
ncbi:MAG: OmpH family outer membrane protein [Alistipes sp.]|nr:OmpH family outer membrane protein [Alistipes sp.]